MDGQFDDLQAAMADRYILERELGASGRELVYRSGDGVLAVSMDLQRGQSGPPTLLFAGPYPDNPGFTRPRSYDASRDGERFLMTKLPAGLPEPRVMVVENWFSELRAKVPK